MEKVIMFLLFFSISIVNTHAQVGNVGINTNTPEAMLHVKDSSVVFTGMAIPPGTGNPPISGLGTRMMWYSNKAAFRAGRVSGLDWDKDSIGIYSAAFGFNNVAKGISSFASGASNSAYGNNSTAFGSSTIASGIQSFAAGNNTVASGQNSFAVGFNSVASGGGSAAFASGKASGSSSFAIGSSSNSSATWSFSSGNGSYAKSFNSAVFGRFNDSTSVSGTIWVETDPLFIIGNGDAEVRSNAMTVLKNGDTGIGDHTPNARLHISEGASGGIYFTNAEVIIEDDEASYLQFSAPADKESGILSGNAVTSIRSALNFRADSSVQIRTGGNTTRLAITKNGDIGMGTLTPDAKLDVNGTTILGTNGTVLTEVIKLTVAKDVGSVAANSSLIVDFTVANAAITSTAYVSPQNDLANGLIIAYTRVNAAGIVRVKFSNVTGAAIDPPNMNYYITVIR